MKRIFLLILIVLAISLSAYKTNIVRAEITDPTSGEILSWDSTLNKFVNGAGISTDSLNVKILVVDSTLTLNGDMDVSHIEATDSQMLFNLKPPVDAVDGQKIVWSFVINDSLPVMQIGTTANDSGGVYADSTSIWQIDPAHVTAYVSASDTTTCATADTYYTLQATFTNKSIKGFTVDSTGVTHLGAKERTFSIVGDWGGSADANNTTVRIALYKNGSLVAGSESPATLCRVAGEAYVTGINTTVDLKAGDKITIVLKADGAGDIITTNDFPIQIEPL